MIKRSLKIVFEHTGKLPVIKHGGTERILFWLMRELVKIGHKVTLIGHPQSDVEQHGITLVKNYSKNADWRKLIPSNTDIVTLFYPPKLKIDQPLLVIIGGNGKVGEIFHPNTVFVSKKHAALHGSKAYVYHGLPLEEYPFKRKPSKKWSNFFFLAKAKWGFKNLNDCLRVCKEAGKNLDVAGGSRWHGPPSLFFNRFVRYHGMLPQHKKIPLMEKMDAFLWPVRWHEPFGIAVIEAYSQGLPVICSPYGSCPELVNEKTGIICRNYAEFLAAISRKENDFDSEYIRFYLEENFNARKMALEYLRFYEKILRGETINPTPPKTISKIPCQTLLPF